MHEQSRPTLPPGERIYAIGDIHGRLDLLTDLLGRIRADSAARPPASTSVVLLGDLIDRGPASADVVRQMMAFTARTEQVIVLQGNHEVAMVDACTGNLRVLAAWLDMGGDATLASWGVDADLVASRSLPDILKSARQRVLPEERDWLESLPLTHRSGDYLFVHAGVRPGIDLAQQVPTDLQWIGDDFLDSVDHHGAVIVHGHTIVDDGPVIRHNRIGLDTGAYRTGRLTALGLEAEAQWTLATGFDA